MRKSFHRLIVCSPTATQPFSSAFWLYIVSQIGFLAFFGGVLTLKTAVLIEQTLVVILVILLVRNVVPARS